MKCPHCITEFHPDSEVFEPLTRDSDGLWAIGRLRCPACNRLIMRLVCAERKFRDDPREWGKILDDFLVHPQVSGRRPVTREVPDEYSADYKEACWVLAKSPKASAALSRRCLQHILRGEAKVKHQDLSKEIQEVIDRGTLPSHIVESLDAVRNIGNFATHPVKSQSTGEIVAVEAGEAEWNLDVLESLFDFFFVAPARTKARKDALDKKLSDAGKP